MSDSRKVIWHPEVNILFGQDNYVFFHSDMDHARFDILQMYSCNPWTALSFGRRDVYLDCCYERFDAKKGVGYEDWCWNRRVLEAGCIHKVVWGTGHVIRRKEQSLVKVVSTTRSLPSASSTFRKKLRDMAIMGTYGAGLKVDGST